MKTVLLALICMASFNTKAQSSDSVVTSLIEAKIQIISDYLDKKEHSLQKISEAVAFFTELTGIASEADGKYYGQYHPSIKDKEAWANWVLLNKQYLFWDKEIKSIILYKKIKI